MDQGAALSFGGELGQRGEVSKNLGPMGTKLWQTFSLVVLHGKWMKIESLKN
jgi:hypothetical protein